MEACQVKHNQTANLLSRVRGKLYAEGAENRSRKKR